MSRLTGFPIIFNGFFYHFSKNCDWIDINGDIVAQMKSLCAQIRLHIGKCIRLDERDEAVFISLALDQRG